VVRLTRILGLFFLVTGFYSDALAQSNAPTAAGPDHHQKIYVSPSGNDQNAGSIDHPILTLSHAQELARVAKASGAVTVYLREGVYYLKSPLVFTADDSGTQEAPVVYQAYEKEQPVISGGCKLENLDWKPYQNSIMQTPVPADLQTDQLFVNGERQILARYPNYDPSQLIFNGSAADAISPERVATWSDPTGGFLHAMHPALWGDFSYVITGKTPDGQLMLEGGWQNNRPSGPDTQFVGEPKGIHKKYRFVENIFEELDAPREWFLNTKTHTLYFYPPQGLDLGKATVEAVRLKDLVEFQGNEQAPVKFVSLKGITFRQTLRTFMETREPLLRADWAIYRGGALFFNGAEDCSVEDCFLDQLGGNAIFVNNYNRRIIIRGCHISKAGANGVAFVGDPNAARSPLFNYNQSNKLADIDRTPGPLTDNYPAECLVDDCLIHETGFVEKQTAPIEIDLSQDITVRHCSIYDVPRAGINIGDGCWGGHVIEFCDIFDTVRETGDHGSYNSWGRDRYWLPRIPDIDALVKEAPDLPLADVVKPIILRNNRWRCDHGWDIDLDDGSSNYQITNNLCLHGGIKNREGFDRVVENNVLVNNTYYPQCWPVESQDTFTHNIMWAPYKPAQMHPKPWGKEMDNNFIQNNGATATAPATKLQAQSGHDENSLTGDAMFVDPASGNYDVKDGSPVLALGFVNFPMDQFGVQKPELKAIARTPELPGVNGAAPNPASRDSIVKDWNGAQVRNIRDEAEMSAYGTPGVTGVLVLKLDPASPLAKFGLQADDVILGINHNPIIEWHDLFKPENALVAGQPFALKISRNQAQMILSPGN
jgi:hypothetical protein